MYPASAMNRPVIKIPSGPPSQLKVPTAFPAIGTLGSFLIVLTRGCMFIVSPY